MTGRWTYRVSAAGVLLLAAAAFTLSYDALHQLALDSRVRPALAWLWPVVIDGTIVVALLTVLAAKRTAARAGYPWALALEWDDHGLVFPNTVGKPLHPSNFLQRSSIRCWSGPDSHGFGSTTCATARPRCCLALASTPRS
jgi:hypothetical protein